MFNIKFIIHLMKSYKIIEILYILFMLSLIQVADLLLTVYLSNIFGEYLVISLICLISLVSLFIIVNKLLLIMKKIEISCQEGILPLYQFNNFSGTLIASALLFMPGFISDTIGLSLLLPLFSVTIGNFFARKSKIDWYTVYEYMKI